MPVSPPASEDRGSAEPDFDFHLCQFHLDSPLPGLNFGHFLDYI